MNSEFINYESIQSNTQKVKNTETILKIMVMSNANEYFVNLDSSDSKNIEIILTDSEYAINF